MWLRLHSIQLYGFHGVHAYEQEHGGKFEIDVELLIDTSTATKTDDVKDTVDYVKLHQAVQYVSSTKRYHLIETLANEIAAHVRTQFGSEETIVRVRKPGAAIGGVLESVEVECRLTR